MLAIHNLPWSNSKQQQKFPHFQTTLAMMQMDALDARVYNCHKNIWTVLDGAVPLKVTDPLTIRNIFHLKKRIASLSLAHTFSQDKVF